MRDLQTETETAILEQAFKVHKDKAPTTIIPLRKMNNAQQRAYYRLRKQWYKHHTYDTKPRGRPINDECLTITKDPAVQRYFTHIRNKPTNAGYLSDSTEAAIRNGARHFLQFLKLPITETAISELVAKKRSNPTHYSIDDAIEDFANPQDMSKIQSARGA
jgi:hypothetical protein